MKKIIAIALALVMVMGLAVSASALEWNAPAASTGAGPFKVEVIKLTANSAVTGKKYFTVVEDAAAYGMSTIYYAIKLVVPSAKDAKAYYAGSSFLNGDSVKVTITYTNISGKSKDVIYVDLKGYSQTLWFNGSSFDEAFADQLAANCGCNDRHIMASTVTDTALAGVKVCIGLSGDVSDILIGGCYKVAEKHYYGIRPCQRCNATNLDGWLFTTDCGQNSIFISTNASGKVTGVYVYENCPDPSMATEGAMVAPDTELYRWGLSGDTMSWPCNTTTCTLYPTFTRVPLENDEWITSNGGVLTLSNGIVGMSDRGVEITQKMWDEWLAVMTSSGTPVAGNPNVNQLFVKKNSKYVAATCDDWKDGLVASNGVFYRKAKTDVRASGTVQTQAIQDPATLANFGSDYREYVNPDTFQYGNTYLFSGVQLVEQLYAVQAERVVECDTKDLAFWNSVNYLFGMLGITYADVAAGNIYMTEDNLLSNFGFATSICSEKTWNAYTAAITVATVADVPATGSMSYVGFAMIVLAIAAAVVTKKVRA